MQDSQQVLWTDCSATNGKFGESLADALVALIKGLDDVRRVCDLGCGNGYLAGKLAELGYEVTGIDGSSSGIELARKRYPRANFLCGLIDKNISSTIGDVEFDVVISSDVIEHLYRPSSLLETATILLKTNGHLIIGTPYHGYWKNLVLSLTDRMDTHWTVLWDGGHIKFFSVRTLSQLLERHGFTDLRFSFYGRVPYLWKNMFCHALKTEERQDA